MSFSLSQQTRRQAETDETTFPQHHPNWIATTPATVQQELARLSLTDATSSYTDSSVRIREASPPVFNALVRAVPPTSAQPLPARQPNNHEIQYTPEAAFVAGNHVLGLIEETIRRLEIADEMRTDVWKQELAQLSARTIPKTFIALCGATGAGKSSLINAILDDTILPTSGMQACTAVVTEISHHPFSFITADIEFASYLDWRAEIDVCIMDLTDNHGGQKKANDVLDPVVAVAWSRMHAVYPNLSRDRLVKMTPDQVIASNPIVAEALKLGKPLKVSGPNSAEFTKAIAKYIDSKETKHGEPAWWPLVRVVKIQCNAKALETGAVLVDLPGVGDSNAARSSITPEYMKRCNYIFIVADIARAISEKIAKDLLGANFKTELLMDGNYNTKTVTFIATKTDGVLASEIIPHLDHSDLADYEAIEKSNQTKQTEAEMRQNAKTEVENEITGLNGQLGNLNEIADEYRAWIDALQTGVKFSPQLIGREPQRRRNPMATSAAEDSSSDEEVDDLSDVESAYFTDAGDSVSGNADYEEGSIESIVPRRITADTLKNGLEATKARITEIKKQLDRETAQLEDTTRELSKIKKEIAQVPHRKNLVCAKARNKQTRAALVEGWREGIRDVDNQAALDRDPNGFDANIDFRDYNSINLDVYTVSARDYNRIKRLIKGDGGPECFTDENDTEIPQLRRRCRDMAVASRERAAQTFLTQLKMMAASVKSYASSMPSAYQTERNELRARWASRRNFSQNHQARLGTSQQPTPDGRSQELVAHTTSSSYDAFIPRSTSPQGIAEILNSRFQRAVQEEVNSLKHLFEHRLETRVTFGACKASAAAVKTSQSFSASMAWNTYRAHLVRHGIFRRNLNQELSQPMSSSIAGTWAEVFEGDLFSDLENQIKDEVQLLLEQIESDVSDDLIDLCTHQCDLAYDDAKATVERLVEDVKHTLDMKRKDMSRCFAPNVQRKLVPGYNKARLEVGKGSFQRQRYVMDTHIDKMGRTMFGEASQGLMNSLDDAAMDIGAALRQPLQDLARKVEVHMSVVWDIADSSAEQAATRENVVQVLNDLVLRIDLWLEAGTRANTANALTWVE